MGRAGVRAASAGGRTRSGGHGGGGGGRRPGRHGPLVRCGLVLGLAGLLSVSLGGAFPVTAGAGASAVTGPSGERPRRPVVLVGDPVDGLAPLGVPGPGRAAGGLYEALRRRGHVPGRDLFAVEFPPGDDFARAAGRLLPRVVGRALARSGAGRVDLVTVGGGALAARFYVESLRGSRFVESLVMVRPPFRGSRLLAAYRELGVTEAALRARRASRRGRGEELILGAARMPYTTEVEYVDRVSFRYFEPLYGKFAAELAETPPGARSWPASFPVWLRARRPAEHRSAFAAADAPPLAERGPAALSWDGGPGEILSRAYLNAVALGMAGYSYRQFEPWVRVAASGWEKDLVWEGDWRATLLGFLARRAEALGTELVRRGGATWSRAAVLAAGRATTGVDALDPSLHHLVTEEIPLPGGAEGERLLANAGLVALNAHAARRREGGAGAGRVRYVTVTVLPPRWVAPLLGRAGELLQEEVETQVMPPGLLDEVEPVAGAVAAPGLARVAGVLEGRALAAAVLRGLAPPTPEPAATRGGAGGGPLPAGEGVARVRRPVLVDLGEVTAGSQVRVEALADPPRGLRLAPFLVVVGDGGAERVVPLRRQAEGGPPVWGLRVQGDAMTGRRILLGARLLPARAPSLAALEERGGLAFRYGVAPPAGGGSRARSRLAGGGGRQREAPVRPPTGPLGGDPVKGVPRAEEAGEARAGGPAAEGEGADVTATYRNKHTSLLEEDRTYHVRWEWDFGDGSTWVDDDPDHTTSRATHLFPPGEHLVRARSWSNKGTLLRQVTFTVRAGAGGARVNLVAGGVPGRAGGDSGDSGDSGDASSLPRGAGGDPGETSALPAGPGEVTLVAETAREPPVGLELLGPRTWVTGRRAVFRIRVDVGRVPRLAGVTADYDPGETFTVRWRKPGVFRVQGAVRLTLVYGFPEGPLRIRNTYVVERQVEVLAPSVTG